MRFDGKSNGTRMSCATTATPLAIQPRRPYIFASWCSPLVSVLEDHVHAEVRERRGELV